MADSWIICEDSGRWAAALRAQITRLSTGRSHSSTPRRIHEVRHFGQFQQAIIEEPYALGLLEVRREAFAIALNFLSSDRRPRVPIVALLHESVQHDGNAECWSPDASQVSADALREAGALTTVNSPRRVFELSGLTERLLAPSKRFSTVAASRPSFAEWARAALPWQDE